MKTAKGPEHTLIVSSVQSLVLDSGSRIAAFGLPMDGANSGQQPGENKNQAIKTK